jgi:starch phosphorylase
VEQEWKKGYNASLLYSSDPTLRRIVDELRRGFNGQSFADIADYLALGSNYVADPYMCLRDYGDYMRAYNELDKAYLDKEKWYGMSLVNIAESGIFAADRSIDEYAKNIWGMTRVK